MSAARRPAPGDRRFGQVAAALAAMPLGTPVSISRLADRYLLDPKALQQDLNAFSYVEADPPSFAITADFRGNTATLVDADRRLRYTPDLSGGERFGLLAALATWTALPRRLISRDLRLAARAVRKRIGPGADHFRHERGVWCDDVAEPLRAAAERGQDVIVTTAAGRFHVQPTVLRHTRGTWMVDATEIPTARAIEFYLVDVVSVDPPDAVSTAQGTIVSPAATPPEVTFTVDEDAGWWLSDDQSGRVLHTCETAGVVTATIRVWPEDVPWWRGLLLLLGPSVRITDIAPGVGDQNLPTDVARSVLSRYQARPQ